MSDQESGASLSGALVHILDGDHAGLGARTGEDGRFLFENVAGEMNLLAAAEGFGGRRAAVNMDQDRTLDFELEQLPPGTAFGPGRWEVGDDIAPGRYFADPRPGCFWERVGDAAEILASEFLDFDAGQEIVDIAGSDRVFEADADCGGWEPTPTASVPDGTIPAGRWLVGRQVEPGVYETAARAGCYWARLRRFSGETTLDVVANDFVAGGGGQRVEVQPSDAGFFSAADCGTWRRSGGIASLRTSGAAMDPGEMERNRELYRSHQLLR